MPSLRPYPAYADTDLPWLPKIPKHWDVKPLKHVVYLNPEVLPETTDPNYEIQYLDIGNVDEIDGIGNIQEFRFENAPSRARRRVRAGDTIISTVRTYLKAVAYFENPPENQIVSTGFAVLRSKQNIHPKFLSWLIQSKPFVEKVVVHSNGIGYPAINPSELVSLKVWIPPLPEQRTIAAYLDRQTAKIDALIAKKQRLLDLLAEQRAALISQAVTKGVPKTSEVSETSEVSPMKDSGVAWLGQVPSHWEVLHLRRVINKFVDYRGHTPPKVDEGIPLITARNIKNGKIDWELSQEYIPEELYAEWMVRGFPELGDVLVTMEAPLGETAQITETHIALAQRIILLKADKTKIQNDYLKYFLASSAGQGELWCRATGSTAIGIKASRLKEVIVLVPPIKEQNEIVKFIKQEEDKVFALIPKVEQVIARLQEYRAALISSVVTGKVQVKDEG